MTDTVRVRTDRTDAVTRRAVGLVAQAWHEGFLAVETDDEHRARRLLRESRVCRAAVQHALAGAGHRDPAGWPDDRALHVLAGTVHLNRLLGRLAQTVLTPHRRPVLTDDDREATAAARLHGHERLRLLAATSARPVVDHDYVECGWALLAAARRLSAQDHPHGRAAPTCRDLTTCLIRTSQLSAVGR